MGRVSSLISHLEKYTEARQTEDLLKIVEEHSDSAIDLNLAQLFAGKDSKNNFLEPPYRSVNYAELKLHLNPAGVVDLKLSGDLYNGWFLNASKFPATFGSTDIKFDELSKKYGEDIAGLDSQSKFVLIQKDLRPSVIRYYKQKVFKL